MCLLLGSHTSRGTFVRNPVSDPDSEQELLDPAHVYSQPTVQFSTNVNVNPTMVSDNINLSSIPVSSNTIPSLATSNPLTTLPGISLHPPSSDPSNPQPALPSVNQQPPLTASQLAFLNAYSNPANPRGSKPSKKSKKKSKKSKKSKPVSSQSSTSPSSSSSNDSSSSSSSDDESTNWSVLRNIWPVEKRPLGLQNKTSFNAISLDNLLCLAKFDRQNLKAIEGDLSTNFNPDRKPKTTSYKKAKDNGFKKLHPARFQRYPLANLKDWWKHMPKTRNHLYKNLDLKFMGANNKLTQKTIQGLHDRTKSLQFKMFLSSNVNVANKPVKKIEKREEEGIVSTLDYAWENPTSLSQISDGLLNYSTALMHIWPYDPTGLIIMRLVNKYNYASAAPTMSERISVISTFFNMVLRENATRAIRKDVIMSHQEQEEILKSILTSSGYNSSVPVFSRLPRSDSDSTNKPRFVQNSRPGFSNPSANKSKINVVLHLGNPICFNYNTGTCRNPSSSIGCRDTKSGKDYAHACNKWLMSRNTHCFQKHPRFSSH